MQEVFSIDMRDYITQGVKMTDNIDLMAIITEWEYLFHKKHTPYFATHLFANYKFMSLLDYILLAEDNLYQCGMDIIDGDFDVETNSKMDEHSKFRTIYGLGSEIKDNYGEPIYLVKDESLSDGIVILKHISENDNEDEIAPVPKGIKEKTLV